MLSRGRVQRVALLNVERNDHRWWEESFSENESSHHQSSVHRLLQGKVEEIFYLNQIIHCESGEGGKMNQLIRDLGYRLHTDRRKIRKRQYNRVMYSAASQQAQ